jgi:hypothetical protein
VVAVVVEEAVILLHHQQQHPVLQFLLHVAVKNILYVTIIEQEIIK